MQKSASGDLEGGLKHVKEASALCLEDPVSSRVAVHEDVCSVKERLNSAAEAQMCLEDPVSSRVAVHEDVCSVKERLNSAAEAQMGPPSPVQVSLH